MSVTDRIVDFALASVDRDKATGAREMMLLSLFDWLTVSLAGQDEPISGILRNIALTEGGSGQASVFGTPKLLPTRAAALVNGTISHALDYDDTHFAHIGHPSVAVIPAALALAQQKGATGAEFLDAALIGAEGSIRIGQWLGRSHYQIGFHQTATAGAFGATLAAARLLGLNVDQTGHAIGVASTRAAGLKSQFGTMGKPYHAGLAAQTGVEAAQLAKAGFVSNPHGLDGDQGFAATHAGAADGAALDGLGRDWQFETISHKFHACCHGTHAMLEALFELRNKAKPDQIARVTIATHPRWLTVCDIAKPATGLEMKFSFRATAAMALLGRDTSAMHSFSDQAARDPKMRALAAKVRVVPNSDLPETASQVSLTLKDRKQLSASHDLATPLPLHARREKLRAKASSLIGADRADRLWKAIHAQPGPDLCFIFREISSPKA